MAIRLNKTTKIILAIVILILSVALGYLIWRINQPERLDPTDSDAGGGFSNEQCRKNSCSCKDKNGNSITCDEYNKNRLRKCYHHICKDSNGNTLGGVFSTNSDSDSACRDCGYDTKPKEEGGECNFGSECAACPWPKVANCSNHKCGCILPDQIPADQLQCGSITPCNPPACPQGMVDCGTSADSEDKTGCSAQGSCIAECTICKNKSIIFRHCKAAPTNVCDGGSWIDKPTGNIDYGKSITFSAKAKDSDGIKRDSIVVKKGTETLSECSGAESVNCIKLTEAATETTISGTLSTPSKQLAPGNYTISMSWKDKKDVGGEACALTTSFVVLEKQTNPDWEISKSVVEQCIDDSTEDPKAELTYTIAIKNTGDGAGQISKIEDVLDDKVQSSFVQSSSITPPGKYEGGKIIWDYISSPLSLAAGESKVYTYKILLDKENFETYSNTATLTPVGSPSLSSSANIVADCIITTPDTPDKPGEKVPQTGLFDSVLSRIAAGVILVIFGVFVYNIPNTMFASKEPSYKYRDRFERKVANR